MNVWDLTVNQFIYLYMGILLIFFRNCKATTLLSWTVGLLAIPATLLAVQTLFWDNALSRIGPAPDTIYQLIQDSLYAYGHGTYAEMFEQRLIDLSIMQESSLIVL